MLGDVTAFAEQHKDREVAMEFLETVVFGAPVLAWAIAAGVTAALWLVLRLLVNFARGRLVKWAAATKTEWDDILVHPLQRTSSLFLLAVAIFAATLIVTDLPARLGQVMGKVLVVALILQAGVWLSAAVARWVTSYRERKLSTDAASVTTVMAGAFLIRLVLWSLVLLLVMANLGIEIAPLVAGLGVGGIAIALAVQSILSDLFASLSIVLDKPFVIGDFITVDTYRGVVEHVGLKTTRIRSLTGEQLVFANNDLLSSRLRNYGRMQERRVNFAIGVTYQTERAKLAAIPALIRAVIAAEDKTRFDRSHLKEYGDFAIIYESVYYVLSSDYNEYMDIQQAINLGIHDAFTREGIEFAYPTQTLFVNKATE